MIEALLKTSNWVYQWYHVTPRFHQLWLTINPWDFIMCDFMLFFIFENRTNEQYLSKGIGKTRDSTDNVRRSTSDPSVFNRKKNLGKQDTTHFFAHRSWSKPVFSVPGWGDLQWRRLLQSFQEIPAQTQVWTRLLELFGLQLWTIQNMIANCSHKIYYPEM